MTDNVRRVLITGGAGYIGQEISRILAREPSRFATIVADMRKVPPHEQISGVVYRQADVRDPEMVRLIKEYRIDTVVHLASIVNPGGPKQREFEYSVDVLGTKNMLQACMTANVSQFVITSSGAAYGYHADNPLALSEHHPLRGNPSFPYSDHKRQVEEMLEDFRKRYPDLKQLIFRPCTVLGECTRNSITELLDRPWLIGLRGFDIPFVLIWDQDVARCIVQGIERNVQGIYNLAGDGVLTMKEIAQTMNKPVINLPPWLLAGVLRVLRSLGLSRYGPEHIDFLRYRPVLANEKLKQEFGYTPEKTTRQVLEYFLEKRSSP